MSVYELVGYLASILIAISLMMRSILRLRLLNLIGAVVFTIYGLLIQAYPVAAVNFFIVLIDLYYLYEIRSAREYFKLLEVAPGSDYLLYFLNFYRDEILRFLPGFEYQPEAYDLRFFVLRDLVPAGLVIGKIEPEAGANRALRLALDFVIPGYRDFKSGKYVYQDQADFFRSRGIQRIYSRPGSPEHAAYLKRMGFTAERDAAGDTIYCLDVH